MKKELHDSERYSLIWRKAKASQGNSNCVELARTAKGLIAVRDSKNPEGPVLVYTPKELIAFFDGVHKREFDDLLSAQ